MSPLNKNSYTFCQAAFAAAVMTAFATPSFSSPAFAQTNAAPTMQWQAKTQTINGAACFVKTGPLPGPTVVIVATGILYGNEDALSPPTPDGYAVQQILDAPLLRGKIVVVHTYSPDFISQSGIKEGQKKLQMLHPDWLVVMHDNETATNAQIDVTYAKNASASDSVQKMVVLLASPDAAAEGKENPSLSIANTVSTKVSPNLPDASTLMPLALAASSGSTHIPVLTIVSAGKAAHSAPSVRTRFLRLSASRLLQSLHMEEAKSENALLPSNLPKNIVRVAMYDSDGATGAGPANLEHQISAQTDMVFRRVCAGDIQSGVLKDFDVVIHPGGSGTGQGKNLGPTGLANEKAFITRGGGYIGICGGDYLASNSYPWSLGCVDADVLDRPHWLRGKANLQVELTPKGREIFGDVLGDKNAVATILYHNGPVLSPNQKRAGSNYEPLAVFKNEISAEKGVKNIMVGSAAIAADQMGKGRVLGISPHPEQTPGMEAVVPRAVRWVARRPLLGPPSNGQK